MSQHPIPGPAGPNQAVPADTAPALHFDPAAYAQYLEGFDLSETQRHALLQSLWLTMADFVDLGFKMHPVQQVLDHSSAENPLQPNSSRVQDSDTHTSNKNKTVAARFTKHAAERPDA